MVSRQVMRGGGVARVNFVFVALIVSNKPQLRFVAGDNGISVTKRCDVSSFLLWLLRRCGLALQTLISMGAKHLTLIQEGQVWRLLTPILLHGGVLHIFMNVRAVPGSGFVVWLYARAATASAASAAQVQPVAYPPAESTNLRALGVLPLGVALKDAVGCYIDVRCLRFEEWCAFLRNRVLYSYPGIV